ncbi:MAG: quinone oxidoreductase [Pseudomonadota bacterium]
MPIAIEIKKHGGPEVLEVVDVPTEALEPSEIQVHNDAIGVNFIDTYFREGLYGTELPAIIGDQAVATITALGSQVEGFSVGDKVAYASIFGAYRGERCLDPRRVIKLPEGIDARAVAATLTRGLTAEYLLFRLHQLQPGEIAIIHAAAGGTGVLMTQWAKSLGATVIGTVGAESKKHTALSNGCDHVLLHHDTNFIEQVSAITDGRMADVVYDSIGKDTFHTSIKCLKPRGLMVAFGNASGKPDPLEVLDLARLGSLFLTRPILSHYIATATEFNAAAARYFDALITGTVKIPEITEFALNDAAKAHQHLQDRSQLSIPILVP